MALLPVLSTATLVLSRAGPSLPLIPEGLLKSNAPYVLLGLWQCLLTALVIHMVLNMNTNGLKWRATAVIWKPRDSNIYFRLHPLPLPT